MAERPDMQAIQRRYEWGCYPLQCSEDRGTMIVWIGELEHERDRLQAKLDIATGKLEKIALVMAGRGGDVVP